MLEEKEVCCSGAVKTLVLSCSGGSNVGQIANNVMIELDRNGVGNAFCLAGVGADLSGFLQSTEAGRTILIDGCPVGCGMKIFQRHGIEPSRYFVITELDIEKKHAFDRLAEETKDALNRIVCDI